MSKATARLEYTPEDVPHVDGSFLRSSEGNIVSRTAFIGTLDERLSYTSISHLNWDHPQLSIAFQTIDQLDAIIDGLDAFRKAWIEDVMAHESGQMSLAAD